MNITISLNEAREAFHCYLTFRGAHKVYHLSQEEAFWQFLGTSIKEIRTAHDGPFAASVTLPEDVVNKIRMLNGPHKKAIFKAIDSRKALATG